MINMSLTAFDQYYFLGQNKHVSAKKACFVKKKVVLNASKVMHDI